MLAEQCCSYVSVTLTARVKMKNAESEFQNPVRTGRHRGLPLLR